MNTVDSLKSAVNADEQGEWDKAHEIVSSINHPVAFQLHAYLHRKEGDYDNALFWYGKAGVNPFSGSFEEEITHLKTLIAKTKM